MIDLLTPNASTSSYTAVTRAAGAESPRAASLVSVVVPVTERPEPLAGLYEEFSAPLRESGRPFEFVFAVSPTSGAATEPLAELVARGEPIRILGAERNVGETALLREALKVCRGQIVVTLPAYRRVRAPALLDLIDRVEAGVDVATARRWPRRDPLVNRLQHRALHVVVGRLAAGRVRDVGCGVRAVRREAFDDIPLYGDFARFLPLLALFRGYRVEEIDAPQHPRDLQTRVYSPGVYVRRSIDLFGLYFLLKFMDKPLRFFGLAGAALGAMGGAVLLAMAYRKIVANESIGDKPLLLLGVLLLTLGAQAVALGLIGEMIVHFHAPGRRFYRIRANGDERRR
jgi:glycosyltransferase involved in cell wall biosynthesis